MSVVVAKSPVKTTPKLERLLEFAPAEKPMRVDRDAGVIHDVKLIGKKSRWGHTYTDKALSGLKPLYEGKRVELNHHIPKSPTDFRKIEDGFGEIRNVRQEPDGNYGDLHYLKSHPLANMIAERAERFPHTLGMSHDAKGEKIRQADGSVIVDDVPLVRSVDLVYEGATTDSLFEAQPTGAKPMSGEAGIIDDTATEAVPPADATPEAAADPAQALKDTCFEKLCEIWDGEGDPKSKLKQMTDVLKSFVSLHGEVKDAMAKTEDAPEGDDEEEEGDDEDQEAAPMQELRSRLTTLENDKRALAARDDARTRIAKAGLPQDEPLIEAVAALPADKRDPLLESWKKGHAAPQVTGAKPRSASPQAASLTESAPSDVPKADAKQSDKLDYLRN